ncbi:MAG: glycine betaine/L-proline ABC transporter ATP-binding protein [Microcoleaceae cyanobacterium]
MDSKKADPSSLKINIEQLIKIYGQTPKIALKMHREGAKPDQILHETGNTLAIADISLTVNTGELFVVMGLSGSGKSTLVRCINRLIKPTSGHIYLDGEDIAHVDEKRIQDLRRTKISMVFQNFGLFPHKTVLDNVEYGLKIQSKDKKSRSKKALETLEIVGLAQWKDHYPNSLSGGMQQRVGLARALATDAEVLLMDEAFSALDPLIRREMQNELLRLQSELHKTIIFISHDIQEALKIGDRIAVMKSGSLVQIGTPETLVTQPKNDYIRAFLQEVNRAQVLKVDTIMREHHPLILDENQNNLSFNNNSNLSDNFQYVIDSQYQLIGIINHNALVNIKNIDQLMAVIQSDFPVVNSFDALEVVFPLLNQEMPIAVVDQNHRFQGIIQHNDVLSVLGKLTTKSFNVSLKD